MVKNLTTQKNWFIDWHQEWSQFWEDCNWYDFNVVWIAFENDKIMGGYDATFIILGLGFRWRWNHTMTPQRQECLDAIEDIHAGTITTRPYNPIIDEAPEAYIHKD